MCLWNHEFFTLLQVKAPWQRSRLLSVLSNSICRYQMINFRKHERHVALYSQLAPDYQWKININMMTCLQNYFVSKPPRPHTLMVNSHACCHVYLSSSWDCVGVYRLSIIGITLTLSKVLLHLLGKDNTNFYDLYWDFDALMKFLVWPNPSTTSVA